MGRAKVYKLEKTDNDTPGWIDKGTGHATIDYDDEKESICIIVISEKDQSTLLKVKLHPQGNIYYQERDSLIVWQEPDTRDDLALSFSDKKSCKDFWDTMTSTQAKIKQIEDIYPGEDDPESPVDTLIELPPVNLANLEKIYKILSEATAPLIQSSLAGTLIEDAEYLDQLFDLWGGLEDNDLRRKHIFFDLFKRIILLNDRNLLQILFSEKYILPLIEVLENDPDVPVSKRVKHRQFIAENSSFKEVVPIQDKYLLNKIHQTFRVKYLKESILMAGLDDLTQTTIESIIIYNNLEIITKLEEDDVFLSAVFKGIQEETDIAQVNDLVAFLKHFCDLSKILAEERRSKFFQKLLARGMADIFRRAFSLDNLTIQQNIIEIFCQSMMYRDIDLREYILDSTGEGFPLLRIMSEKLKASRDSAVIGQFVDIFRRLVDTDNIDALWRRKEEFLSVVYKFWFPSLILQPVLEKGLSPIWCALKCQLFDLLAFCVPRHASRIRSFIISNNILEIILEPNLAGPGDLKLAVIRLFRQVVGDKDRKMEHYITSKNLYDPIMQVFRENCDRYNMVNSAIVELFNFIDKEYYNNHRLIGYLVERYKTDFESVTYVPTFSQLIQKYESHQNFVSQKDSNDNEPLTSTGKRKREDEEDEEAYFGIVSDEPSTPPITDDADDFGAGLPPLKSKDKEDDEDSEIIPVKKRRKLEFKSISYHKTDKTKK